MSQCTSTSGIEFGRSFKIEIENSIGDKWPEMLNDAVFYGTQAGGKINWKWGICTTYTSKHPAILLHMFDLFNEGSVQPEKIETIFSQINFSSLGEFTDWVENKRIKME